MLQPSLDPPLDLVNIPSFQAAFLWLTLKLCIWFFIQFKINDIEDLISEGTPVDMEASTNFFFNTAKDFRQKKRKQESEQHNNSGAGSSDHKRKFLNSQQSHEQHQKLLHEVCFSFVYLLMI